jgi:hypothetical protein
MRYRLPTDGLLDESTRLQCRQEALTVEPLVWRDERIDGRFIQRQRRIDSRATVFSS